MALIRDFELPNSGATIPNAYHVISEVQVHKRIVPFPEVNHSVDPLKGQTGYVGVIFIQVFGSKQARDDQKKPIAFLNDALPEKPCVLKFVFDPESSDSSLTQAYKFLKTTAYYAVATED